jgi:hypothetical protein
MVRLQQWAAACAAGSFSNCAFVQFCPQNFDAAPAPALPSGWSSTADGAGSGWNSDASHPLSVPNAAFAADVNAVGNSHLDSPPTLANAANSTFSFRHVYQTEAGFDGGVLEISIAGGPFQDFLSAGGSFVIGGYTATVPTTQLSPIGGRHAWIGSSGGYVTTIARLPSSTLGASVVLRWRLTTDQSITAPAVPAHRASVRARPIATTRPPMSGTMRRFRTCRSCAGVRRPSTCPTACCWREATSAAARRATCPPRRCSGTPPPTAGTRSRR